MAKLGAKWGFVVPDWNSIETEKGKYRWNTAKHRLDDAVHGMVKRKIAPIIQIYGGNRLYMPAVLDTNQQQMAAAAKLLDDLEARQPWHRFLEAMVRRYKDQVKVWEIWNEPNGTWFWHGPATVEQYGRMVQDVAEVIKHVDLDATILAGATASLPLDFAEGFLDSQGADSFDYWSVHPYGEVPEQRDAPIRRVQELLRARGKPAVLWQTECGFPSSGDTGGWGYGGPWDETKHAKWVLRRMLSDAALGMPVSICFVLNDYNCNYETGSGAKEGTLAVNRKGLYHWKSWEPKPAAHAFRHLSSLIDDRLEPKPVDVALKITDYRNGKISSGHIRTYTLSERESGSPAVVYWLGVPMQTKFEAGKIQISPPKGTTIPDPVLVDLLDGRVYAVDAVQHEGRTVFEGLPLSDSPVVLCSRRLVELMP